MSTKRAIIYIPVGERYGFSFVTDGTHRTALLDCSYTSWVGLPSVIDDLAHRSRNGSYLPYSALFCKLYRRVHVPVPKEMMT